MDMDWIRIAAVGLFIVTIIISGYIALRHR